MSRGTWRVAPRSTGQNEGRIACGVLSAVEPSSESITITTLRAAAAFVGVEVSPDPGVGHDLPPYEPTDGDLGVDAAASFELGAWFAFGHHVLGELDPATIVGEEQLWPEHFDLSVVAEVDGSGFNIGFSPGDTFCDEPYVYVGPHDLTAIDRTTGFWNAPFGAYRRRSELGGMPSATAIGFVLDALS